MTSLALNLRKIIGKFNNVRPYVRSRHVWSADNVVRSPFEDVVIPDVTYIEYLWQDLEKWPTKTAVVCGITNRNYSYESIFKQTNVLAANLRKKFNVNDGDVIGVMSANNPEYSIVTFGILTAGAVVTTFNPLYTAYEVKGQIQLSDPKVIVADSRSVPVIKEAVKLAQRVVPIITIDVDQPLPDNTISYVELVDDAHVDIDILKDVKRNASDIAFVPYSSGTTGLPKGVELTNYNIVANCRQQSTDLRQNNLTTETNQDVAIALLPLYHMYGLGLVMLDKLAKGLKIVTLPKFEPETFLNAIVNFDVSLLYVAPPIVGFLGSNATSEHFRRIRLINCGASPLAMSDINQLLSKSGNQLNVIQAYGMTEASPLVTMNPKESNRHSSVGVPIPNTNLRVVDENMKNLGPGEIGQLLIKGPNIMKGYKNNPEANKDVFLDGDWCKSGDNVEIDDSGYVYVKDRLKELIKVKGYQVSPSELEQLLKQYPGVQDVAVIGVPDSITGEKPKAFIVPTPNSQIDKQDIIDFVGKHVTSYKKIKEVDFIDSIPRNVSGKVLKKSLK